MGALDNVRVLDLTQVLAGPYTAMLLGDMGADVLKIEPPGGDQSRQMAPTVSADTGAAFLAVNRNKRGLCIDLRRPEGQSILRRLVATADVLIESNRPQAAARLGLNHDLLAEINPGLVTCSITGFGSTGPYASRGGFDLIAQGMSGVMSVTGSPDAEPVKCGVPIADLSTGLFAAYGILCALRARDSTGIGQHVDAALLDSAMALEVWESVEYFHSGQAPRRSGSAHRLAAPYQAFRCSDGHVTVAAHTDKHWRLFCQVLNRTDLLTDPRFADNTLRLENLSALTAEIEGCMERHPRAHWLARLTSAGIPNGPINSVAEAIDDEHARARGMVLEMQHPRLGPVLTLGPAVKLSATPAVPQMPPPDLGQHTRAVLGEVGFSDTEIEGFRLTGVFG